MDADRHIAEFRGVFRNHLGPTLLVKLLSGHLRWGHVREHPECAILALVHPRVAVSMIADVALNLFQVS